ncbi:MAG: SAM-dependent methyltransferase, partial [Actinomycetota bacterium]
ELVNWALSDEYHDTPGGHVRIYRRGVISNRLEAAGLRIDGYAHAHGLHSPYWWLKCAVGTTNNDHKAVAAYHRLLVWDIEKAPRTTRWADKILSPIMGKSMIVYLSKLPVSVPVSA